MEESATKRIFRFGVFEADEHAEELRKHGRRLTLQGQPLKVLLLLLGRPGVLVTRKDIQEQLWPNGTFVDFDHGLNTAINKIREALGDSAGSPRFVETLARRGYRFIAPVETSGNGDLGFSAVPEVSVAPTPLNPPSPAAEPMERRTVSIRVLTSAEDAPQAPSLLVRTLFLLLQAMYLCFYLVCLAKLGAVEEVLRGLMPHTLWAIVVLIVTAAVGIPTRLYLISAISFRAPGMRERFLRIFPVMFPLDELWALAPFLLIQKIGFGLALGATAALLYVPFAQRTLVLMGAAETVELK